MIDGPGRRSRKKACACFLRLRCGSISALLVAFVDPEKILIQKGTEVQFEGKVALWADKPSSATFHWHNAFQTLGYLGLLES